MVQSNPLTLTSAALLLPSGVRAHLGELIGCIVRGPILGLRDGNRGIIPLLYILSQ